ncbi:ornithine decarboxylase 1-like [Conger conger]|uniref:ornithine decarboxylase 1-like n=1 Tax=Conger conger TaxID=82655 RepID=UPI002A59E7A0|nr:ornithine decarboxylase 1-like [Conger conger]
MSTFTPEDFGFTFLKDGTSVQDFIDQRIKALSASDAKDAFYVADLGEVMRRYLLWVREIPRVTPFYAVKCNESRPIVMMLAALGTGFDCASKYEMHLITSLGVDPSRIIYANTIKQRSHLKYAAAHGIQKMVFDNEAELIKIAQCCENAKLVLRIAVDDKYSKLKMSKKFGAKLERCPALLKRAQELGLDVIGVSFHVGSYCMKPVAYTEAIANAKGIFDLAAKIGYKMTSLDLGGGYPGFDIPNVLNFKQFAVEINLALDKYFPVSTGVQIISEPGRFFQSSAYTLAVNIIGKRVDMEKSADDGKEDGANRKTISYYVNDGIHTSFEFVVFPNAYVLPSTHKRSKPGEHFYPSTICGQTCDGHDQIVEHYSLPEAQEGEWMFFHHMGAYSVSVMTDFNGFPKPETQFVMTRKAWQRFLQIAAAKGDQVLLQQPSPHDEPDAFCPVEPGLARKHNLTGKEGK